MDYVIAIPSHRRSRIFVKRTLTYLRQTDVDLSKILLFLSDDADNEAYRAVCDLSRIICRDAKNATDKFNAIHYHYLEGTRVFVMEDDVHNLCYRDDHNNPKRQRVKHLDKLIRESFERLGDEGIWGINPHDSTHYTMMWSPLGAEKRLGKRYQFRETLNLIVAHAFGFVSTRDPELAVQEASKTDYERTCLYYRKYGTMLRRFDIGVKTESYTVAGGMQANHTIEQRAELEAQACMNLVERFPDLLDHNFNKYSSPFAELRLRYRRRS